MLKRIKKKIIQEGLFTYAFYSIVGYCHTFHTRQCAILSGKSSRALQPL